VLELVSVDKKKACCAAVAEDGKCAFDEEAATRASRDAVRDAKRVILW